MSLRQALNHIQAVAIALVASRGARAYGLIFAAALISTHILVVQLLSGTAAEVAELYAVSVGIGIGGYLWYSHPPHTFEPNRGSHITLLAWAGMKGLGASFWLIKEHSEIFKLLAYAGHFYIEVLFMILFVVSARPQYEKLDIRFGGAAREIPGNGIRGEK